MSKAFRIWGLVPVWVLMVLTLILPILIVAGVSVANRGAYGGFSWGFDLSSYREILFSIGWTDELEFDPKYVLIIGRTLIYAAGVTAISLSLAVPVAYFISLQNARWKLILMYLVTLPFWVSMIVRVYAWLIILGNDGLAEKAYRLLGGGDVATFLFTPGAMLVGMVYSYIPLMILPVFASIEKIDPALIEASHDLYGSRWVAARRVILPLTAPGIAAGSILVFVPSLGTVLEPMLLGGGKQLMMGTLIQTQFGGGSQLALWCRHCHCAFGAGHFGADRQRAPRHTYRGGHAVIKHRNIRHYPGFRLLTLVFFLWLYLPIAVVVFYSFNDNRLVSVWTGFSTKWYAVALENEALMNALEVSFVVATISTLLATCVALLSALVLTRATDLKFRRVSETVVNLPLLLPEIVLAVAVLILFSQIGLTNGIVKLILAHTAFCTPFAFLPIRARLQGMSQDFEEAAKDLYAAPLVAFRRVTLPMIMPGVFAGMMTAFVISMDDFITSNMLNSGGATTLPVYIFSLIRQGTTPELNAISTLLILASLALATLALVLNAKAVRRD